MQSSPLGVLRAKSGSSWTKLRNFAVGALDEDRPIDARSFCRACPPLMPGYARELIGALHTPLALRLPDLVWRATVSSRPGVLPGGIPFPVVLTAVRSAVGKNRGPSRSSPSVRADDELCSCPSEGR
jgi:hypothetical protein